MTKQKMTVRSAKTPIRLDMKKLESLATVPIDHTH